MRQLPRRQLLLTNTDPSGHCVIAGQQIYAGPCRQAGSSSKAVAQRASEFWDDNKDSIRPLLEVAKNISVAAVAITAAGAWCLGTAGVGCPIAVGGAIGAVANSIGDEVLDCASGDYLNLSWREAGGQF